MEANIDNSDQTLHEINDMICDIKYDFRRNTNEKESIKYLTRCIYDGNNARWMWRK